MFSHYQKYHQPPTVMWETNHQLSHHECSTVGLKDKMIMLDLAFGCQEFLEGRSSNCKQRMIHINLFKGYVHPVSRILSSSTRTEVG